MTLGFVLGWLVVGLGFLAIADAVLLKIDEDREEARKRFLNPWSAD